MAFDVSVTLQNKLKPKKCKICLVEFRPISAWQVVCCYEHAIAWTKIETEKKERSELRKAKQKIKARSAWMREAQAAFNAYIRERDFFIPCISCGRFHEGQWHAGHYRTTKAEPELRFDEDNCHKQCQPCNTHLSGNLSNYRAGLLEKIGPDRLAYLEGPHEPKKYTIDDLRHIKKSYQLKLRELKNKNGHTQPQ